MTNTGHGQTSGTATPSVLEDLSDEECALWAILTDHSGLDQAEFLWHEQANPDGCWRAWSFQWSWWRASDQQQIDCSARSIGKCLVRGTKVVLADGRQVSIEDLVGEQPTLMAWDSKAGQTAARAAAEVYPSGVKPVIEVSTRLGRSVTGSADHRVLTEEGWKTIGELAVGDRVASPRTIRTQGTRTLPEHEIRFLALAICDAKLTQPTVNYTKGDPELVDDFIDATTSFGNVQTRSTWYESKHSWEVLPVRVSQAGRQKNPVLACVERHGLYGKTSPQKTIPPAIFELPNEQLALFLGRLLSGDGCIEMDAFTYSSASRVLIEQVRHLLLRLGIISTWRERSTAPVKDGPKFASWELRIPPGNMTALHDCLGQHVIGPKAAGLASAAAKSRRLSPLDRYGSGDLIWDAVTSIEPAGEADTFDITMDGEPNFIANDIVVHNSESIKARACAFPFVHPGQEMVITAPELVHLEPIVNKIESQMYATRLYRQMLVQGRSGVTHRPFMMNFVNQSRIIGRIPQKDGKGVKGCSGIHEFIFTDNGLVKAGDLQVGDLVLTHEGRYKPILAVHHDENDCYEVVGQQSFPLTVSCDHRFMGVDNEAGPKQKRKFSDPMFVDVEVIEDLNFYWASPTKFPALPVPPMGGLETDKAFWWLVGRYLADGYLAEGGQGRVVWCAPDDKATALIAGLAEVGLKVNNRQARSHSSADALTIRHQDFHDWLEEHFGRLAGGKKLPAFVLGMDKTHREALLQGYLDGDGWWNPDKRRWEVGSASKVLVVGVQLLAQSLGYTVNCTSVQPKVTEIRGVELKEKPQVSWRIQISDHGHPVQIGDHRYAKVKSVTPVGKKPIVNIVVEGDHSYVSGSIVSHNIHPVWLEMDEAQDYGHNGWRELTETLNRGLEGSVWRAHGVTRGVRDDFFKFTQDSPDNPWKVHRYPAMYRPTWTDEERQDKIKQYGSRDDPDYRRNVLGLHGDSMQPIFVLSRLMDCVDDDLTSDYNTDEYTHIAVKNETLNLMEQDILDVLMFPSRHKRYLGADRSKPQAMYWVGMDIGMTRDPSEIMVFVEFREKPKDEFPKLKLLTRVSMTRVGVTDQTKAILSVIDFYKPKVFAMDRGGLGLPFVQIMKEMTDNPDLQPEWAKMFRLQDSLSRLKGYNFGEKIIVDFDPDINIDGSDDPGRDAGMRRNTKEYGIDKLRSVVDNKQLILPWDEDVIGQFQGGSITSVSGLDQYGRRRFSKGDDHTLDAAVMMTLGWKQYSIEEMLNRPKKEQTPVLDAFVSF